jgi:ribonuclease VapC
VADYVIDASSVLVAVFGEPGAAIIDGLIAGDDHRLLICSVNLSEVLSKMLDTGMPLDVARQLLLPLGLEEVPFGPELAISAAALRTMTRVFGLSLGDRCCLALAKELGAAVLTADRPWLQIASKVGVEMVLTRSEKH